MEGQGAKNKASRSYTQVFPSLTPENTLLMAFQPPYPWFICGIVRSVAQIHLNPHKNNTSWYICSVVLYAGKTCKSAGLSTKSTENLDSSPGPKGLQSPTRHFSESCFRETEEWEWAPLWGKAVNIYNPCHLWMQLRTPAIMWMEESRCALVFLGNMVKFCSLDS